MNPTVRIQAFKLLAGKLLAAWRDYPRSLQELRSIPEGPPIFVTGTHRSGTTWVATMLAVPGVWYVHEPFFTGKGLWHENFSYVRRSDHEPRVDRIMKRVLRGGHRFALAHPWVEYRLMPMRLFRPLRIRRALVKDPIACLMSEYLTDRFGFETLVLFRHPAGFAWGLTQLGWPIATFLRQFLQCGSLMEDWLHPYRKLIESACQEDSLRSATVMHGCLNAVLWGYTQRHPKMRAVSFEMLCMDPIEQFRALYDDVGLPHDENVRSAHAELCFAGQPGSSYRTHEVRRNSRDMASRWRSKLDHAEQLEIRRIWEQFDVPLYREPSDW